MFVDNRIFVILNWFIYTYCIPKCFVYKISNQTSLVLNVFPQIILKRINFTVLKVREKYARPSEKLFKLCN